MPTATLRPYEACSSSGMSNESSNSLVVSIINPGAACFDSVPAAFFNLLVHWLSIPQPKQYFLLLHLTQFPAISGLCPSLLLNFPHFQFMFRPLFIFELP